MKKKERQRIKRANKLLISALTLGALVSPTIINPAFADASNTRH